MAVRETCFRCNSPVPQFATIRWICVCGYRHGILNHSCAEVLKCEAGKLLPSTLGLALVARVLEILSDTSTFHRLLLQSRLHWRLPVRLSDT